MKTLGAILEMTCSTTLAAVCLETCYANWTAIGGPLLPMILGATRRFTRSAILAVTCRPILKAICDALRGAIRAGRLGPSPRTLLARLNLGRNGAGVHRSVPQS